MSLSLMAVPVLLDTTTNAPQLYHQWARMYHYGHQVLPTAAVATFLLYTYTAVKKHNEEKKKEKKKQKKTTTPWAGGWAGGWAGPVFLLAGVTTLSILPFTWIFMLGTNNELFRLEAEAMSSAAGVGVGGVPLSSLLSLATTTKDIIEAKALVASWSRLHFIRSLLPLVGAVIGAVGTFGEMTTGI